MGSTSRRWRVGAAVLVAASLGLSACAESERDDDTGSDGDGGGGGTFVFAGLYGPAIEAIMAMGEVQTGDTFSDAWGIPDWLLIAIMAVALVAVFHFGSWFERRSRGPVAADEAVAGAGPTEAGDRA